MTEGKGRERLSEPMRQGLWLVRMWAKTGGTYMPYASQSRTFEALERRGLVTFRSVDEGSPYNGYALTDEGRAATGNTP